MAHLIGLAGGLNPSSLVHWMNFILLMGIVVFIFTQDVIFVPDQY